MQFNDLHYVAKFAREYPVSAANFTLSAGMLGLAAKNVVNGNYLGSSIYAALAVGAGLVGNYFRGKDLNNTFTWAYTTMPYHLIEELLIFQTPMKDYFTQLSGITPHEYADVHTPEYVLLIWGLPVILGVATVIARNIAKERSAD